MIGDPTTLKTSCQSYHNFVPSSFINNDTTTIQPVIAALRVWPKNICECCGRIGHKADALIICVPNFLPTILKVNNNQLNALHDYEPNEPSREWNKQTTEVHFKYRTSPPKNSPVVSAIMGRINHHEIYNGDVEVHP